MAFNENLANGASEEEKNRATQLSKDIPENEDEKVNQPLSNDVQKLNIRRSSSPATNSGQSANKGAFKSGNATSNDNPQIDMTPVKITPNGLDARLERLIDIVADYLKKSPEEVKRIKENALKNPQTIQSEYMNIYSKQIVPLKESRHTSIESAKAENPDKIVFLHVRDDRSVLKCISKEKAGANVIYDGLIVETVSYNRTPFPPANELFKEQPKVEVISEEESNAAFSQQQSSKMKM